MTKVIKVGDYVGFKYDIEQKGKVEKIGRNDYNGEKVYYVRAFHGEYVNNQTGTVIELYDSDIW